MPALIFRPPRVVHELEQSMKRLGVNYIDVVYCHDIEYVDIDYVITHTIPALRQLQAQRQNRHGRSQVAIHWRYSPKSSPPPTSMP
jgi:aryl-alcohol dehydrogenase-like predicted oxidoreductase